MHADELDLAEVVLVGVSRTMKTPTMLYLAYHGWFAANVPLVPEIPLPPTLLALPADRVFCLDMEPDRLLELRLARVRATKIALEPYASLSQIRHELRYAHRLCLAHHWRIIDVSGKSVEEVAREIIALLPDPEWKPQRKGKSV